MTSVFFLHQLLLVNSVNIWWFGYSCKLRIRRILFAWISIFFFLIASFFHVICTYIWISGQSFGLNKRWAQYRTNPYISLNVCEFSPQGNLIQINLIPSFVYVCVTLFFSLSLSFSFDHTYIYIHLTYFILLVIYDC